MLEVFSVTQYTASTLLLVSLEQWSGCKNNFKKIFARVKSKKSQKPKKLKEFTWLGNGSVGN